LSKKLILNIVKYVIFLGLGGVLLYFSLRGVKWAEFWGEVKSGQPMYIVAGILMGLGSHVFRTLRWQMLMKAAGHETKFGYTFASLLVGYGFNDLVPRAGELARCTMLYRSNKVPVSVGFGTVVTERLMDVVVLGILVLILLGMEGPHISEIWNNLSAASQSSPTPDDGISIGSIIKYAILGFVFAFILFVIIFRKRLAQNRFYVKMRDFLLQMRDALKSIFKLKNPLLFIFYTLSIWGCYIMMTWVPFKALDSTAGLGMYFSFIVLIMGGIGFVFPSPGGTGSYHYLVTQTFVAFAPLVVPMGMDKNEYHANVGGQAALVLHSSQYVSTLAAGLVAYIWLEVMMRRDRRREAAAAQA
jgi:uncharacterized membrane protein YbhN (UPF0104 family)